VASSNFGRYPRESLRISVKGDGHAFRGAVAFRSLIALLKGVLGMTTKRMALY